MPASARSRALDDAASRRAATTRTGVPGHHGPSTTAAIADDIYLISEGKVVEHGDADKVSASSSAWTRQFLDGLADGPVPFHYPAPGLAEDLLGIPGEGRG